MHNYRSSQLHCDVDRTAVTARRDFEPAVLKNAQHWLVVRQDFRDQLPQPGFAANAHKMAHESAADSLSMVSVDDDERDLGDARLHQNIPAASHNRAFAAVVDDGDERDLRDEIDIHEIGDLLFGEIALRAEEAAAQRLGAG